MAKHAMSFKCFIFIIGLFFDSNDLPKGTLVKDITNKHVTLKYKPTVNDIKLYNNFLGTEAECQIIGYGNDGANEGLFVELDNTVPYMGADRPHITLSVAEGAKAVNTAFVPESEKRTGTLKGRVGYYLKDNTIVFEREGWI